MLKKTLEKCIQIRRFGLWSHRIHWTNMDSFRDLSHDVSLGLRSSGLSAQFAYTLSKAMNVQAVKQSLYGSAVEPPRFGTGICW